ncbi:MAG: hypothetical protein PHE83_17585 [Opitutaceae bacterium]|nr:hypothetical protein [Opitutaceae bacterium]
MHMKSLMILIGFVIAPQLWAAGTEEAKSTESSAASLQAGSSAYYNGVALSSGNVLGMKFDITAYFCIHTEQGDIRINCRTGTIEIPPNLSIDKASVEFWKGLANAFPVAKKQIIEGEAQIKGSPK